MSENPFQAPVVADYVPSGEAIYELEKVALMLRQTKPWVRFASVMTFISSAFTLLGAGFVFFLGLQLAPPGETFAIGLMYFIMGLLYIVPAIYLWRYASRIDAFLRSSSTERLASALEAQKSFWRFVGICMLVVLVIFAVSFVGTMLLAVSAA